MNISLYTVLTNATGDFTCNGLSSKVKLGNLFWDCTREEALEYCKDNMINPNYQFYLENRTLWNEDHSIATPLIEPKGKNRMFGGNFIYTSNHNSYIFKAEKVSRPIPVHDRYEEY